MADASKASTDEPGRTNSVGAFSFSSGESSRAGRDERMGSGVVVADGRLDIENSI